MKHRFIPMLAALALTSVHALAADAATSYSPPVVTHAPNAAPGAAQEKAARKAAHNAAKAADRKLAANVRKAMTKKGDVRMANVVVLAKSGVVTLTGTVPEATQIAAAQQHAQDVEGVSQVVNRLTVRTPGN
ncbi:BON domain-containing protein [Paraburkholderia silvatlantica]|uniref:BON domain-containing protein n=1 Tax=Paraburkholderia silvatlantica TaxID=321895 RepID=A0A2V4TSA2_9BURK|nr:BON domain-containing protein [Paraburkholderia silvatlantica]PYE20488.1 BON domain-containing protein [Paraburkholderia silvatlantica]